MASPPGFRLLGFPVHVRTGFLLFLALVVILNGAGEIAIWLAVFMAVFTLIHELGHALAARATGAEAEIALDFFYGYASFVPTRPLKRWEKAGISLAGPASQIVLASALLIAMGVNPLSFDDVRAASMMAKALWFAGPVIGLINLVPVLPFDGGNIVLAGLDWVVPGRSRLPMIYASIALTVGTMAVMATNREWRAWTIFAVVALVAQVQMLTALRGGRRPASLSGNASIFSTAEAVAWQHGDLDRYPAGQQPSPWLLAHLRLRTGDLDGARRTLLDAFHQQEPPRWVPPDAASTEDLAELVSLLPDPLPTGHPYVEHVLADVLLRIGDIRRSAFYAADSYSRSHRALSALTVSRAAAVLGDRGTSLAWLRTALEGSSPDSSLHRHLALAAELDPLRHDPEFIALTKTAA